MFRLGNRKKNIPEKNQIQQEKTFSTEQKTVSSTDLNQVSKPSEIVDLDQKELTVKKKGPSKGMLKGMFIFHILLILAYVGISIFFMNHYFWNTTFDGVDYSAKSIEKSKDTLLDTNVEYVLKLSGIDGTTDSISAEDIDMEYYFDDYLEKLNKSHNGFAWPISQLYDQNYEIPKYVSYNKEKLAEVISKLSFFQKEKLIAPVDAYITPYDADSKSYKLIPEIEGNTPIFKNVEDAVLQAIDKMDTDLKLGKGCYKMPEKLARDKALQNQVTELNRFVSTEVTYEIGKHIEKLDGSTISKWMIIGYTDVTIDEEAVYDYIDGLADTYDTYGKDRSFTTTDGRVLVLKSGAYGWKTDRDTETKELLKIVQKGETVTREPVYLKEGYVHGDNDIGNSYVEIDLAKQHLYLYIDGVIVHECDLVSGNVSTGNTTPPGVFGITYKEEDRMLTGADYETHVNYWMPFNGSIGLHDATWRKKFGADIYLTKGSHGCINLPYKSAKIIYGYVKTNMPVICYYQ